jgi:dimethylaniline monooxygenase (N-oxide forming)
VLGAGPSGLVACKSLLEAASPDFPFDPIGKAVGIFQRGPVKNDVVLEQEADIGGTFRFRSYEVGSMRITLTCATPVNLVCILQNATLVSSKQLTCFSDFRLPFEHPDHLTLEVIPRASSLAPSHPRQP